MEDRWRRSYPHPANPGLFIAKHWNCYFNRRKTNIQLNLYKICDTFTEEVLNKGNYLLWEQKIK